MSQEHEIEEIEDSSGIDEALLFEVRVEGTVPSLEETGEATVDRALISRPATGTCTVAIDSSIPDPDAVASAYALTKDASLFSVSVYPDIDSGNEVQHDPYHWTNEFKPEKVISVDRIEY
jgi:hypothetical protein